MMVNIVTVVAVVIVVRVPTLMIVMERHIVPVGVVAETVVADGMSTPIRMTAFPFVESRHTRPIQGQPHVAGAEIIVL